MILDTVRQWLRPYQLDWISDTSRYRIALKGRQLGFSDACALEMVLVASGLHPNVYCADCNIVSKRDDDAKDVIKKAKTWVRVLRLDPDLAPYLDVTDDGWNLSTIEFESGSRIRSETQNPDAARSRTGHLYLDEFAFYRWQREIWTGATPSTESDPRLRITIISTPNGTRDLFHEIYTDTQYYPDDEWSRHKVDVYDAIEQGFPFDIEKARKKYTADQFAQEFECKFLGSESNYFPLQLLQSATALREPGPSTRFLGIDTASIVDTTAVQDLAGQDDATWIRDTYFIAGLPYETEVQSKRIGQDAVVDALIRYLRPAVTVVDRTGDKARQAMHGYGLYALLERVELPTTLIGQHVHKTYKDTWVQKLKVGLSAKVVQIDEARRDMVFSAKSAAEFLVDGRVPDHLLATFVNECFQESPFPILRSDFQKVYRKWLGPNDTTFDTERDGTGHGDGFWANVLGYSAAASWRSKPEQNALEQLYEEHESAPTQQQEVVALKRRRASEGGGQLPEYMDYL